MSVVATGACVLLLLIQCLYLLSLYNKMQDLQRNLNDFLIEIRIHKLLIEKEKKEDVPRGANRCPRTVEQRIAAAKQKKEWWARKRAQESKKTSEPSSE
jgi:hypothetical protein